MLSSISKSSKGVAVCLVGVLVLTPDTLLIRAAGHLHGSTLLFYRYGLYGFSVACFLTVKNGWKTVSAVTEIGWLGVLCGIVFGISNIFFTTAVQYTAAANVLVILAINPLFAAIFSWLFVSDVVKFRTMVTMLIGLCAIALIFYDEMSGETSSRSIMGNIFACCTCVLMGIYFAMVRYFEMKQSSKINMVPCNAVAGSFVAIVASVLGANPGSREIWSFDSPTLLYLLLQGIVVLPISFGLLTVAPRYLSAPEVSLFLLIETCLGPLWVYLGGYESPPPNTIIGGSVLILALALHSPSEIEQVENTYVIDQRKQCFDDGSLKKRQIVIKGDCAVESFDNNL